MKRSRLKFDPATIDYNNFFLQITESVCITSFPEMVNSQEKKSS